MTKLDDFQIRIEKLNNGYILSSGAYTEKGHVSSGREYVADWDGVAVVVARLLAIADQLADLPADPDMPF